MVQYLCVPWDLTIGGCAGRAAAVGTEPEPDPLRQGGHWASTAHSVTASNRTRNAPACAWVARAVV